MRPFLLVLGALAAGASSGCQAGPQVVQDRADSLPAARAAPSTSSEPVAPVEPPTPVDSVELVALAAAGPRASRTGLTLRLRLSGDSLLTLVDDTTEGDSYVNFRLQPDLLPLGLYLIERQYYEGSAWEVIDDSTGRSVVLSGYDRPVVAPDSSRLVATSYDFDVGYYPNVIQVVRLGPAGPQLEWELETGEYPQMIGWGASAPAWRAPDTVAVTKHVPAADGTDSLTSLVLLVRADTSWRTIESPP